REDVSFDGPEVRGQKSPVLHLVLQNAGAAGPRKVQIDYLAPGLSWKGDYSVLLGPPGASGTPEQMQLDGWVTVQNDTGADICANSVDLVAGEVQLLLPGAASPLVYSANAQVARLVDNLPHGHRLGRNVETPGAGAPRRFLHSFSRSR